MTPSGHNLDSPAVDTADETPEAMRRMAGRGEVFAMNAMRLLADRFGDARAAGWVDLKLDPVTGLDHPTTDGLRGPGVVYGWIQGRALEAIAGHVRRLDSAPPPPGVPADLAPRLRGILAALAARVRRARARNGGHLFFFMDADGGPFEAAPDGTRRPVALTPESPANFSDLFAAKGLLAAADLLGDADMAREAVEWLRDVARQVFDRRFVTDQQALDPANPVRPVPGRHSLGPFMIQLGTAALWLRCGGGRDALGLGARLLEHLLDHHVRGDGGDPGLAPGDVWEFVDDDGRPWQPEGVLLSDPGHALEAVGLAWCFVRAARPAAAGDEHAARVLARARRTLPLMLERNFAGGFNHQAGGIRKLVDLRARRAVNGDMPWWSLPETMRAALLTAEAAPHPGARATALAIHRACASAFFGRYVTDFDRGLAVQTRDAHGMVSAAIPATADLDPGYHSGLSLLDCVACVERMT